VSEGPWIHLELDGRSFRARLEPNAYGHAVLIAEFQWPATGLWYRVHNVARRDEIRARLEAAVAPSRSAQLSFLEAA